MTELTLRQREVLDFITDYIEKNDYPPTVREIASSFKVAIKAAQDHLTALQKKGYITISQKQSRSISVVKDANINPFTPYSVRIPMLKAKLSPFSYLLEKETIEGFVILSEPFIEKEKKYFIFNINASETALVEITDSFSQGQTVAVYKEGVLFPVKFLSESENECTVEFLKSGASEEKLTCLKSEVAGIITYTFKKINVKEK